MASNWVSQLLTTPDSRLGWLLPAVWQGLCEMRRHRFDVLYSTSPCMTAHLIAFVLSHVARAPWVADFRDPWGGNPFRMKLFRSLRRWDGWLERLVLRRADRLVCATPTMTALLVQRFPSIAHKCETILNGFDREITDSIIAQRLHPKDCYVLGHAGQFYGPRGPEVWLKALRLALEVSPDVACRIRMLLIGESSYEGTPLREIAARHGIEDVIDIAGPRVHHEALSLLAGCDALMLAGAAGPGADLQVPNKLFEYLALQKPVLASVPKTSPVVSILREAGVPAAINDPGDANGLARSMVMLAKGLGTDRGDYAGVMRFERTKRADQLVAVFESLCADRSVSPGFNGMANKNRAIVRSMLKVDDLPGSTALREPQSHNRAEQTPRSADRAANRAADFAPPLSLAISNGDFQNS